MTAFFAPAPASAHPFGPPQTLDMKVGEGGRSVTATWHPGAIDDYSYLAAGLRLVATDRSTQRGGLLYAVQDMNTLAASPLFVRYISNHIKLSANGPTCSQTVGSTRALVPNGVRVTFTCAKKIDRARVMVSMLTDLHPAYRTLATGPGGQRFVYTVTHKSHDWAVADANQTHLVRSAVTQVGGVMLGLAVVAVLTVLGLRARNRKKAAA